jgi:hypothetical protein
MYTQVRQEGHFWGLLREWERECEEREARGVS